MTVSDPALQSADTTVLAQEGRCSWYGGGFHGQRTSNGERFDQKSLTAAHPSLPFGTNVEVTALETGKTVRVRINDRGPFTQQRVLDVSYAAACSLGITGRGVAKVALKVVDDENLKWPSAVSALQVASFPNKAQAESFLAAMTAEQKATALYYIKPTATSAHSFTVRFGPFAGDDMARTVAARLKRRGLHPELVAEDFGNGTVLANNASGDRDGSAKR